MIGSYLNINQSHYIAT